MRKPIILDMRRRYDRDAHTFVVRAFAGDDPLILYLSADDSADAYDRAQRMLGDDYTITSTLDGEPAIADA